MKEYNIDNIDNIAVLIGIDCANKKHYICEHHNHTEIYNYSIIKHKPQALNINLKHYMSGQWISTTLSRTKNRCSL